jgi:type IX secretion system PorP/SprF family membrane protein
LVLLLPGFSFAQDIHFSQFDVAPMVYNPAMTGQFDGNYRVIANQRTQWRSVTTPYMTIGGSVDARNLNGLTGLGTSLAIYQDQAGDSHLKTLSVDLGGSWLIPVSSDSLHTLSTGVQLGFTNRKIDYSQLTFDNQWSGISYDPGLSTNETFTKDSYTNLNVSLGAGWFWKPERRKEFYAGFGVYNLTNPKQSFYGDESIRLDTRFNLHANSSFPISDKLDLLPSALFQTQGKFKELILGTSVKYLVNDQAGLYRTVFGGMYYRTRDAGYILAGMDYDDWRVALSYDINLSKLRPASEGRGGLEISVVYIFRKLRIPEIGDRLCPDFI